MQPRGSELEGIRKELLLVGGALHLLICELNEDAVLDRNHCDHPLPLYGASARDARSVFLDGHLQPEDDCGLHRMPTSRDIPWLSGLR